MNEAMNQFESLSAAFSDYLLENRFLKEPLNLYEPIDYILQIGGKRVRPVLVLMAARLFDNHYQKALPAALAVEVFHNFTLVHDDIMDDAPIRRGQPAVHTKYNLNTGILSGDVMLILVYKLLMQIDKGTALPEILRVFNDTAILVCEGQQYDMDFEKRSDVSIPEYITMIEYKTAVLMAVALKIGAIIGGANNEDAQNLYEFGRLAGIAFQLQDDLLDTYGNPEKFGKKPGGDIIQNKKTFLTLTALERANETDQKELLRLLNSETKNASEKIKAVINIYDKYEVKNAAKERMLLYMQHAYDALEAVNKESALKMPLKKLAESLIQREV